MSVDIRIADVNTAAGTQSRASISEVTVADYAEKMQAGEAFPDIVLFHDGTTYWLADGFHRVMAASRAGKESIAAEVRKGTKRDAILFSVGTNGAHGLPRTNADKRHAVMLLLIDEEWTQWSNKEIARRCCVNAATVDKYRAEVSAENRQMERKVERAGKVYMQDTSNIGRTEGMTRPNSDGYKPRELRVKEVAALAETGHRATQIAAKLGIGEAHVRNIAKAEGIHLADADIGKTRRIDNRRVIEQTVLSLESSAKSLASIPISFDLILADEAREWDEVVTEALRTFRKFHKQIQEAARG